jgi:hypothetical protein
MLLDAFKVMGITLLVVIGLFIVYFLLYAAARVITLGVQHTLKEWKQERRKPRGL